MKVLKWLDNHVELLFVILALCSIVIIMTLQIFMRYVLNASLSWPEELSRYLFIWFSFIGFSYVTKKELHLKIELINYSREKVQKFISLLRDIGILIFSFFMLIGGIEVFNDSINSMQVVPALQISFAYVYLALPVGFGLCIFRVIQKYLIIFIRNPLKKGEN